MSFQGDSIFWVEVEKVVPNPFQPRREFNEAKLKELAESVRMYGILQPLTVTRKEIQRDNGAFYSEYELIAGERRLRASKLAGLAQVPVIIREGENNEQEKLELAIIENLQREDLNAVDRGLAFKQLAETFSLSHAQVAKKVGRSREYVSNTMRLLLLPEYMLSSLKVGDITEGHARTLLMLNDRPEQMDTVYREILLKKLSVREVERITRKIAYDKVRKKKWVDTDPELIEIERKFTETLGTRVQICKTNFGGKLTIDYFSQDDLEKLLFLMKTEQTTPAGVGAVKTAVVNEIEQTAEEDRDMIEEITAHTPLEADISDEESNKLEELEPEAVAESSVKIATERATSEPTEQSYSETQKQEVSEPVAVATDEIVEEIPEPQQVTADSMQTEPEQPATPIQTPPVPQQSISSTEIASSVQEATQPSESITKQPFITSEEVKEKEEDDSDLYTIKNFGI